MPPVKTRWSRAEIAGARLHWLLDISYASGTIRLSGDDLEVTSTEHGTLAYHGGIQDITYSESMTLFADGVEPTSADLSVIMPPEVSIPLLVAQGHDLAAATATLSQWVEGTTYEARRVVIVGRVRDASYGLADEPIEFAVEQAIYDDHGTIPDPRAVVDDNTWSNAARYLSDFDKGVPYPLIFGYPGKTSLASNGWVPGARAIWCDKRGFNHKLLIAGHAVAATQVYINQDNDPNGEIVLVDTTTDDLGRTVTIVDYNLRGYDSGGGSALPSDYWPSSDENVDIFVGFYDGGGMTGHDGRVIRGAGDVMEAVLDYSSFTVDRQAWAAASPLLGGYKLDCAIDEGCVPWEWVSTHCLPLLPVSIVSTPNGIAPIVWRFWATTADAVAHLDATTDEAIEVGRVEVDSGQIRNSFRLDFGLSRRTGEYQYVAALDAEAVDTSTRATATAAYGNTTDDIRIFAATAGAGGAGIYVTLTATAGAGVTVTDDVPTSTVTIVFEDGVATGADIVTEINSASTLITAADSSSTAVWSNVQDQVLTLALLDQGTRASPYCERSQARYANEQDGGVYVEALESSIVYDQGTADAILDWRARAFCFAHRRVTVLAPDSEWGWLARGDVVTFTYDALEFSAQVAMVEAIEWQDDGMVGLRLLIVDDPVRDLRRPA